MIAKTVLRGAAVLACAAAVILAGCSSSPSVVAYVGNQSLTLETVDRVVGGVKTAMVGKNINNQVVINWMIQGQMAEQVIADRQITITDADRDKIMASIEDLQPMRANADARPLTDDLADVQILVQLVGEQELGAEFSKYNVKLNPRYGVFDPQTLGIADGASASLSEPSVQAP